MTLPLVAPTEHGRGTNPIPARAGIGLKPKHFSEILETKPNVGWFEVHPENYFVAGGPMHHYLSLITKDYPLSFHSVGMSLGSATGPDEHHIQQLKGLCERYEPALVSDHLSWSRFAHTFLNDLLPMPYTNASLRTVLDNIDYVQNILGRTIAIENPSSYIELPVGDMEECEFLVEVARKSGATILLDINNIHVSASNHGWSKTRYLDCVPASVVSEIHLAGHKIEETEAGTLLIDDHGSRVCPEVWDLYRRAIEKFGACPVLIEWDSDVPALSVLLEEAQTADDYLK